MHSSVPKLVEYRMLFRETLKLDRRNALKIIIPKTKFDK